MSSRSTCGSAAGSSSRRGSAASPLDVSRQNQRRRLLRRVLRRMLRRLQGAAARENLMAAAGGADAHAAAQVLQRSFQRRRAAVPNRFGLTPVKEASTPARTPAKTSEKQQLSPAALLAQQHVRQQHEQQQRRLRLQQQRLQQLQRQQALHQPPSAAGSEGVRRPVESSDQQRRLAGQV